MAAQVPRKREETLKAVGRTERSWRSWEEGLGVGDTLWKERGAEVPPETLPGHEEPRRHTHDSRICRATGPPPLTSLRGGGGRGPPPPMPPLLLLLPLLFLLRVPREGPRSEPAAGPRARALSRAA